MDASITTALGLGFVLGLRHALDADHVAAVSTLVSQHRTVFRSCLLGTFWGAGHTVSLMAAALVVIAFKLTISPEVERGLEAVVALVLVLLGGHVLLRCARDRGAGMATTDPAGPPAAAGHAHVGLARLGGRPFLLGIVHGMAGSAALMLVAVTAIPSVAGGLLYVLVFGLGSTIGMFALSGLIGLPFVLAAGCSRSVHVAIQVLAGSASLLLGLWIAHDLTRG